MRRLSLLPLLVLALLAVPSSASAVNIRVGIGDQSPEMFDNAAYQALHLKITRYFIEWDAITDQEELDKADAFVAAARQHGVKVLMHISTSDIKSARPVLPTVAQYRKRVGALIRRYKPLGVKEWGAWNEANHKTQPTARYPKSAALFYGQMRQLCTGCTIVALDVLDQRGVEAYIKSFMRFAGKDAARVRVVGIHNYSEVNRRIGDKAKYSNSYPGTRRIIAAVQKVNKKAKFWYTETGGLTKQGSAFPCDDARAANRTKYMFTLAKRYQRYVQRLYTYNWTPSDVCEDSDFDGGLVNVDGSLRPAYRTFKSSLSGFKR
ncbi:MAG: hypothetical protein QOG56_2515 [Solirubrobacteraceae bacterium]|nr:hypothetical protein [Solirubrobacteraceae bacterium]